MVGIETNPSRKCPSAYRRERRVGGSRADLLFWYCFWPPSKWGFFRSGWRWANMAQRSAYAARVADRDRLSYHFGSNGWSRDICGMAGFASKIAWVMTRRVRVAALFMFGDKISTPAQTDRVPWRRVMVYGPICPRHRSWTAAPRHLAGQSERADLPRGCCQPYCGGAHAFHPVAVAAALRPPLSDFGA